MGRTSALASRRAVGNGRWSVSRRGFTLIELIVVIALITILATLTVSAVFKVKEQSRIKAARSGAARLAQAVEAYQVQVGYLPTHFGKIGATLYSFDPENNPDASYENWPVITQINGVMSRDQLFRLAASELNGLGSFKDPWGRPYRVVMWREAGATYDKFFQVYSCGSNMKWEHGVSDPKKPGKPDDIAPKS